ncbi:galactose mutarotase-like domain-containing protein [Phascolomyces articulosus]|uniref:Glucose-6-phosphate 1-epimerase n=1 Tax=Phascolomyces articulosus TaxID=60185 RepID=A0AAD5KQK8_9FUNG|nr:galactose mutarotase-like domain-containing protein [Phascolomyces articulosus]
MPAEEKDKVIYVSHSSGASAEIALYGATVTSWKVAGVERLFVSEQAIRDGSKAIRGGIPLVFPIFGTKENIQLPQHGFARNTYWEYVGLITDNDETSVRFTLKDTQLDSKLRNGWPHSFRLTYTVTLGEKSISTVLGLKNEDEDTFEFNTLLHTYFYAPNIADVTVNGLKSLHFIDKVANGAKESESRDQVTVASEVDRIYCDVPDHLQVNFGKEYSISVEKTGLKDTVVWNPWTDKAKAMGDFGDEEYHNMICVEVGSVADWVKLGGGKSWSGGQTLRVL